MAQQFDYPKTETELREIQDELYQHSNREVYMKGIDASYHYEGYTVYKTEELS